MKVAFVTAPPGEANGLARRAIESKLAACVNVQVGITSHFFWEGEIHADNEALLIAKVSEEKADEFVERIREWHSYQCPEVILIDVVGGNPEYIDWVEHSGADSESRGG
ncbi:MAG: divalent-cation tolerance protein CutA [Planctomycetota bacterium]|jgi:periplasmic divalent cation tolerance protein